MANFACDGAVLQPGTKQDDQSKHCQRNNVFQRFAYSFSYSCLSYLPRPPPLRRRPRPRRPGWRTCCCCPANSGLAWRSRSDSPRPPELIPLLREAVCPPPRLAGAAALWRCAWPARCPADCAAGARAGAALDWPLPATARRRRGLALRLTGRSLGLRRGPAGLALTLVLLRSTGADPGPLALILIRLRARPGADPDSPGHYPGDPRSNPRDRPSSRRSDGGNDVLLLATITPTVKPTSAAPATWRTTAGAPAARRRSGGKWERR